jgi:biopolymer transport protein ExbD
MATKTHENPELDMTPMIDVVFELIIFFVVTLKMATDKDETVRLEDGKHGVILTPEELPPSHITIDIAKNGRISMSNVTMGKDEIKRKIKQRVDKWGSDFPVLIRADWRCKHKAVSEVMNACTDGGVWKISFVAVQDRKSGQSKYD